MNRDDLERRATKFSDIVSDEFTFLQDDFGYRLETLQLRDIQYPQDAHAAVPFLGTSVAIEVVLGFGDDSVSVVLYELSGGKVPRRISFYGEDNAARAIRLDSLVRMLSGDDFRFPLPDITPGLSVAEMGRRGQARSQLVRENLRGVVSGFAQLLKEYGSDILKGDTTFFKDIQAYHSKFWRWTR